MEVTLLKDGKQPAAKKQPAPAPPAPPVELPPEPPELSDAAEAPEVPAPPALEEEPTVTVPVWYYLCPATGAFFYAGHRPAVEEYRLYEPGPQGIAAPRSAYPFRLVSLNCVVKQADFVSNPEALANLDPQGVWSYFNTHWDEFFPGTLCPYRVQVVRA